MVQLILTAAAIPTYPIHIIFLIYFMVFHTRPLELGTPGLIVWLTLLSVERRRVLFSKHLLFRQKVAQLSEQLE
jgi:hypothetical protein